MLQDVRYAVRSLVARPSFTITALITLAIGIGATTTIFGVVDAVVLRPLPLREPDRLAVLWETSPRLPVPVMVVSPPNLADWKARTRSFEALGAFQLRSFTVVPAPDPGGRGAHEPEQLDGARISPELLSLLGVPPRAGRLIALEEGADGAPAVTLISAAYWQRRFNGDAGAIGRSLVVDGEPHTIVGIMPPSFQFPPAITLRGLGPVVPRDVWVPLRNLSPQRNAHNLTVIGRLAPGATFESAQRDMTAIAADLAREYPETNRDWSAKVVPLSAQIAGDIRPALLAFAWAVGFVMLLACANVANLLLVRGVTRRREMAIRTALGATPADLVRQLLVEALVLGAAGAALGALVAVWAVRLVVLLAPATMPRLDEIAIDARVLLFALAAGVLSSTIFGLAPLVPTLRARIGEGLHERGGGAGTPAARRLQNALVVAEVSLALVLLVGAGLLVESFVRLRSIDPGFRPDDVLTAKVMLPARRYARPEQQVTFAGDAIAKLSSLPGVQGVALTNAAPLADNREGTSFTIEGAPPWPAGQEPHMNWNIVTTGYFDTLGVRLVRGRTFTGLDRRDTTPVVIINETLASRYFPGQDPIGRRIRPGFNTSTPREIVGVVATERHAGLGADPHNGVYIPYAQFPRAGQVTFLVRTPSDPASLSSALRQTLGGIDPSLAVFQAQPMAAVVAQSVAAPRFSTVLMTTFAVVALMLAAVGLYGVISHAVSQRTREIGIRIALGASRRDVLRMIVGRGLSLAALGIAAGVAAAVVVARLFTALLYGVTATNVPTYALSAVLLVAVGATASYLPARRATAVDPVSALRAE
ncbi:MAG: ABC transporter permease [Vicinamibacterales bacterium]